MSLAVKVKVSKRSQERLDVVKLVQSIRQKCGLSNLDPLHAPHMQSLRKVLNLLITVTTDIAEGTSVEGTGLHLMERDLWPPWKSLGCLETIASSFVSVMEIAPKSILSHKPWQVE